MKRYILPVLHKKNCFSAIGLKIIISREQFPGGSALTRMRSFYWWKIPAKPRSDLLKVCGKASS
jgi:hypothetical protein